jgi:O-antigen/teichoic acid export membrane protein
VLPSDSGSRASAFAPPTKTVRERDNVTANTIAGVIGRIVPLLLALLATPVLLNSLGVESYGLIGLYLTITALVALLDLGLSTAVKREIAGNNAVGAADQNGRVLRTFEVLYWLIAAGIGGALLAASAWLSTHLIRAETLTPSDVRQVMAALSVVVAISWPISLYIGALHGEQLIVRQTVVSTLCASVRTVLGVGTVLLISPSVTLFFLCQAAGYGLEVALLAFFSWRAVGPVSKDRQFDRAVVRKTWRFALSFNVMGAAGLLMSYSDRLVIGTSLPLEALGYYSIAASLGSLVLVVPYAVLQATFPRFAGFSNTGDHDRSFDLWARTLLVVTIAGAAVALPIVFFAEPLITLWTRSPAAGAAAAPSAAVLAVAGLLASLHAVPGNLAVAAGRTRLPLLLNTALLVPVLLATFVAVRIEGPIGAAWVWVAANAIMGAVYFPWVRSWAFSHANITSLWPPLAVALFTSVLLYGAARLIAPSSPIREALVASIAGIAYLTAMYFTLYRTRIRGDLGRGTGS